MSTAPIALVVARAQNGVIGRDGDLPWRMRADLKWFKGITLGKPIIMGRRTYESIGKALPGRTNIVITRSDDFKPADALVCESIGAAIMAGRKDVVDLGAPEICIIGGGKVYEQTLKLADKLYLTVIEADVEGDTSFPDLDTDDWDIEVVKRIKQSQHNEHNARIEVWTRRES
ncbi:MAG: dihydrofolate reductase [Pseudomonadota bacterium]